MIKFPRTAFDATALSSLQMLATMRQAAFYGAAGARFSFTRHLSVLALLLWAAAASAQTLDWAVHPYTPAGEETGGYDRAFATVFDDAGNHLVAGSFYGTADFDPGPGSANLSTGNNTQNAFVAKYDADGHYLWAIQFGGSQLDEVLGMAADAAGNSYVTGNFRGTNVDFDPGPGTALLNAPPGGGGIFVAKYSPSGAYVWAFVVAGGDGTGMEMKMDQSGNVCVTGRVSTSDDTNIVDFDPGPGASNHVLEDDFSYLFLAKYSASGAYLWAKTARAESVNSRGMHIDANNNIFLTGGFEGTVDFNFGPGDNFLTATISDIFVAKYDGLGNYNMAFQVSNDGGFDLGYDIETDAAGNIYVTGNFSGTDVDFDPSLASTALFSSNSGNTDAFIAKYNAAGGYQWAIAIGGDGDRDQGRGLVIDGDNNVYVTGVFIGADVDFQPGAGILTASSTGGDDVFVTKYNSAGVCVWVKHPAGASTDEGRDIDVQGSHLIVCGYFDGADTDFDPGPGTAELSTDDEDALLWKLTTDGEYEWAIQTGFYATSQSWDMSCRAIARDASGNVYVTGTFGGYYVDFDPGPGEALLNASNQKEIFIAKYDATGNYLWAKRIGDSYRQGSTDLALDAAGNIYITAFIDGSSPVDFDPGPGVALLTPSEYVSQSSVIAKYTTDGNYLWAKLINNSLPEGIALDGNGNPYITGHFYGTDVDFDPGPGTALLSSPGDFVYNVFVAGFNADGTFNWAKGMGGSQDDYATDISTGADGSIYITGYFNSSDADFDPGAGTATLATVGLNDFFVAKYNNTGAYQWAYSGGGSEDDAANGVTLDADGNVYVTGEFGGANIDFDPGAGTTLLSSAGNSDLFVSKYTAAGGLLWALRQGGADHDDKGLAIAIDGVGRVYVTGDFDDANTPQGASDVYMSQFDADGNGLLVTGSGAVGQCIVASGDGQVLTGGDFTGTKDFDPGAGTEEFTAVSSQNDMYFGRYSFPPSEIILSGRIEWYNGAPTDQGVKTVSVALSGDAGAVFVTPEDGTFSFVIDNAGDYVLTPTKNTNKLNGLTTADVTRIQRHVANIEVFTDPYRIVAADVNKTNTVTSQDASIINQALLGSPSALNQIKTSWRFIPVSHTLNLPPWGFPETITLTGLGSSLPDQDFYGIKTGDVVSPFTNPANLQDGSGFVLTAQDYLLEAGSQLTLTFNATQFDDLAALQFALRFDADKLMLTDVTPLGGLPLSIEYFGTYEISEGLLKMAWAQAEGMVVEEAAALFTLTFHVLSAGGLLSEALQLDDTALESHAYTSDLSDNKVELIFSTTTDAGSPVGQSKLALLQNRPNPFTGSTSIGFVLPEACEAQLRVYDASGRVLFAQQKYYPAGKHEELFEASNASGVLWYELTTPSGVLTRKMTAVER